MLLLALLSPLALALDPPQASEARGFKDAAFTVELSAPEGATILYGLGSASPSILWPGELLVDGSTILRAQSVDADGSTSEIATFTWLWVDEVVESSVMDPGITGDAVYGPVLRDTLRELPTISLVVGSSLSTTEQRASMEWIDPEGDEVQLDCGVRAVGGHSLGYEKNNLRLNFRSSYGEGTLDLDLYGQEPYNSGVPPVDEHDALNLRGGSHDSVFYLGSRGQYLRNQWMDETQLAMGHLAPHNRWAHLYVNGTYHGIYQVRERFDAGFLAAYLGGDEEDYEAINAGNAVDGSGSAWAQVVALQSDYEAVQEWVNLENFLDYMVLQFYAANDWDWSPAQNWMAAGPKRPGEGGFIFHSSDSDICLYYDWNYNLLHEAGPSYLFSSLNTESHPDFRVLLADRIFLALEEEGPLSAMAAITRYEALAEQIEGAVVAESARWGQGYWDRDEEWVTERESLVYTWFPRRTAEQLRQFRAAGWYPLDAPEVSLPPGLVETSARVELRAPFDFPDAEVWYRLDGGDPRLPGGELAAEALGDSSAEEIRVDRATWLSARLREGETWGPLRRGLYELDEAPAIVLNEWNAVEPDRQLDDEDGDASLGILPGNGGDWLELLVVQDHLDLRGYQLSMRGRTGEAGTLVFTDHEVLSDLRSGTIITVAEDLPQDLAYDPEAGDWRFHLRAGVSGDGSVISAEAFEIDQNEWQLTILDAEGFVTFGPVGEGVAPADGISGDEVGALQDTPGAHTRRWDLAYDDADHSSFGAANTWADGEQDLSILRAVVEDAGGTDGGGSTDGGGTDGGGTDGGWTDGGGTDGGGEDTASTDGGGDGGQPDDDGEPAAGCGCSSGSGAPLVLGLLMPLFILRRRPSLLLAGLLGCAGPKPVDSGATDGGATDGGATDGGATTDGGETAACWYDQDGDGYGGENPIDCTRGVAEGGDCDDLDASVHPGAAERCDERDEDCDGAVDDDPVDGLPFYPDLDGDGYGSDGLVAACRTGDGLALYGGDCDDADDSIFPGATEGCDDGIDQDCDGSSDDGGGTSSDCPASSCLELLLDGGTDDGAYWIQLPGGAVHQLYCDQTRDGGGWTLGFLRNTVATGSQGDFGAGEVEVEGLDLSDEEASDSTEARMSWQDLNLLDWDELRLTAAYDGSRSYSSEAISRDSLRLSFGENGYLLYGEEGYYWCGGDASYTDSGVGAVDNPAGAPSDCRSHGSLGSGWDFSTSTIVNQGLTLCGGDASSFLSATWGGTWIAYGQEGGAQAIWVR